MNLNDVIITDVSDVITVFSKKGRSSRMIHRKSYGLSFTTNGQITYTQNGISYTQDENHAVILPKGQSYMIHGDKYGEFPLINFETSHFLTDTIIVLPINNAAYVKNEFEQMKNQLLFEKNRLSVMSILYGILNHLVNNSHGQSNVLTPAIHYVESNYSCEIKNRQLAYECKLSEEYFRKLFKKTFGISPKQYVTNVRINKAKQLLKEGEWKISAISERCGFSNQYHFCRLFKAKIGLTPTEYLKKKQIP